MICKSKLVQYHKIHRDSTITITRYYACDNDQPLDMIMDDSSKLKLLFTLKRHEDLQIIQCVREQSRPDCSHPPFLPHASYQGCGRVEMALSHLQAWVIDQ